ncbi:MAG: hypothetical protein K6G23_00555 [Lachnospiraceae bacterium]|nr:hypothetical protein [Lachnospiraceae bacterium]
MPTTKSEKLIFGLLMSYTMAYGMEVYNTAINMGYSFATGAGFSSMTNAVFLAALKETPYMGLFVLLTSTLFGNRIGARFMEKHCNPQTDNPYFCTLLRQAGTIAIMCPTMSLIASVLFNLVLGDAPISQLPAIWIGTVLKNFPMAFFWNMFAAAPLTRFLFHKIQALSKSC